MYQSFNLNLVGILRDFGLIRHYFLLLNELFHKLIVLVYLDCAFLLDFVVFLSFPYAVKSLRSIVPVIGFVKFVIQ